jgi:Kef-type K+ transport system membrane component KefB
LFGCVAALGLVGYAGWMGPKAHDWQFVLGVGMSCAVTALPILILLMEKLEILRQPIGQRILRYASLDDIAIWGVLAVILLDWDRVGRQAGLLVFAIVTKLFRMMMVRIEARPLVCVLHLAGRVRVCGGLGRPALHGRRLPGRRGDGCRVVQPGENGLPARQHPDGGDAGVLPQHRPAHQLGDGRFGGVRGGRRAAGGVGAGKLAGIHVAGKILKWEAGEASIIGWLLQTKALIMIIFANILLDKQIITSETFTALLLMAIGSTMLTVPMVAPKLQRVAQLIFKTS